MAQGETTIRLDSIGTIVEADSIRERLLAGFDAEGPVTIDLSDVEEADVTLVQLVLSAQKSAAVRKRSLTVISSPAMDDLLSRAGLTGWSVSTGA